VQSQLLLAQGYSLEDLALPSNDQADVTCQTSSIQLRIYAEDPSNNFSLSVGKITQFSIPGGNGIRVDTHIPPTGGPSVLIGPDFDSLLAKIIVTAKTWETAVLKARRVLSETTISGVKTNLGVLQGVLYHDDFLTRNIDTQWLESNLNSLTESGQAVSRHNNEKILSLERQLSYSSPRASEFGMVSSSTATAASPALATPSSNFFFRKGDAWDITLRPLTSGLSSQETKLPGPGEEGGIAGEGGESRHILRLNRLLRNQFPTLLSAEIEYTYPTTIPWPTQPTSSNVNKVLYHLTITSNTNGGIASTVQMTLRKGSPLNSNHIVSPLSGKLIEMLVREGDVIVKNQVVAFVRQMKMELEVRSPRGGKVHWSLSLRQPQCREGHGDKHEEDEGGNENDEYEDSKSEGQGMVNDQGVDITEGTLLVELEGGNSSINVVDIDASRAVKGKL
jgi:acetyl/propionyl-CoA carboxylase alpha subunit